MPEHVTAGGGGAPTGSPQAYPADAPLPTPPPPLPPKAAQVPVPSNVEALLW